MVKRNYREVASTDNEGHFQMVFNHTNDIEALNWNIRGAKFTTNFKNELEVSISDLEILR